MISDAFRAALGRPDDVGLLVDFDGTLAPIVDDPAMARPLPGAMTHLDAVAGRLGRVAVVSGRPLDFLARHVSPGIDLAGLYGLERRIGGDRHDHEPGGCWREVVADVGAHADAAGPVGMRVETKDLSITLHYREQPDLADAVAAWAHDEAARSGLDARPARRSWELHPPIPVDKGTALIDLADGLDAVCFIGDDHGDLDAFVALDRLETDGVTALRVAVTNDEPDAELVAAADVVLDSPTEVEALLAEIATELDA